MISKFENLRLITHREMIISRQIKYVGESVLCIRSDNSVNLEKIALFLRGWSGGAMVLGRLPVPGCPTTFD